ncbi:MAG: DNA adenine methylase [Calditrichota bacterium]
MSILVPPIKCQGIKTKLVPWIIENANHCNDNTWIEPFMGSGVVGFNLKPRKALFADLNPHIINFYSAIKENKITHKVVREFLIQEGSILAQKGGDYYYLVRERFNSQGNPLDFLFLSRSCFNGVIRFNSKGKYNVPFGKKPLRFSKAYVTKIVNQVAGIEALITSHDWEFRCLDCRESIGLAKPGDTIYCDPPYIFRHVDYYNTWTESEEMILFDLLSKTEAKFILSTWQENRYRRNRMVDEIWSKFEITSKLHFYHVGGKEENRNSMIEALISNSHLKITENNAEKDKKTTSNYEIFSENNAVAV